jgi:putative ABC transport system permease protein
MKKWLEPFTNAWDGVRTHKMRSSLTILGIVIGIASTIVLMSIGAGTQELILTNIGSLGSNLVTITPAATTEIGGVAGAGGMANITLEDAEAIAEQVPYVTAIAPYSSSRQQVVAGDNNTNSQIIGITPTYYEVSDLKTAMGATISPYDYQSGAKVSVIGADVVDTLFNEVNPIGQQLRMGNSVFTVIGVLESRGATMMGSLDDAILIPLTTLQQTITQQRTITGEHVVSSVVLSMSDPTQTEYVVSEVTDVLRSRHEIAPGDDNDFSIVTMEELLSRMSEITDMMTLFLGAVAGIALVVGGIGVMNIMLVSVVERTREIGIRKALGARERDISGQFLTESAFLSFSGGIIGVVIGLALSKLVSVFGLLGDLTTVVSPSIVILALAVAIGIGLAAGSIPARRAARLNPIQALRYE